LIDVYKTQNAIKHIESSDDDVQNLLWEQINRFALRIESSRAILPMTADKLAEISEAKRYPKKANLGP
jgi:hypothetical protein